MSDRRSRRRSQVKQPSAKPLFLVAGLPGATAGSVSNLIGKVYRKDCDVQFLASGNSDSVIYSHAYIDRIVSLAASFAHARRGRATGPTTPAFIFLLYVPSPDQDELLAAFDFSVFPIPLGGLEVFDRGQRLRHLQSAVDQIVADSVLQVSRATALRDRVKLARPTDAILLPPVNFHIEGGRRLREIFLQFRVGGRGWADRIDELAVVELNEDSLAPPLRGRGTQRHFRDDRGIVFFKAPPSGYHGATWTSEEMNPSLAKRTLRALYRFGAPLPQGLQHDAQFEYPKKLLKQPFDCCEKGIVEITASHANIYPDDFVRAGGLARKN